ncbi:type II toxin-antitoxin system VapB family antitoxin [Caenimonas koreensis DSM 17982]|uniref:Type II toxin-antitoxin system VapB family antitoxin n=1 Tax=Caenimonas koreensis DSM 17982 TaxID=1121255 RepID=A0A844ASC8_9BURK|nr:type II toxin-antitoxin system VapB family antitoxin [Caenimonas koreensis]MRD46984.1 type II toxin-antitoxin system VapB family antitoxin [Caenimonas koreensis DSM 17982]
MRTNIDIDDALMEGAMRAGHFKTKKEAVEAGLALLARQAAYREILKWEGKLQWDGDDEPGGLVYPPHTPAPPLVLREPTAKELAAKSTATRKKPHGRR